MVLLLVIKYLHGESEMTRSMPCQIRHKSCYLWVMRKNHIDLPKWKWAKVPMRGVDDGGAEPQSDKKEMTVF